MCDGRQDCQDNSDEEDCPNQFSGKYIEYVPLSMFYPKWALENSICLIAADSLFAESFKSWKNRSYKHSYFILENRLVLINRFN